MTHLKKLSKVRIELGQKEVENCGWESSCNLLREKKNLPNFSRSSFEENYLLLSDERA